MKRVLDFEFETLKENEFAVLNTDADTGVILNERGDSAVTDDEKRLYVFDDEVSARNFIEAGMQRLERATVWVLFSHKGGVVEKFFDEQLYQSERLRGKNERRREGFWSWLLGRIHRGGK